MKNEHDLPLLLTVPQAADLTGFSAGYIRKCLAGEKPPLPWRIIRHGGAVRINRDDLLAWAGVGRPVVPPARRRGRPSKAETMARQQGQGEE